MTIGSSPLRQDIPSTSKTPENSFKENKLHQSDQTEVACSSSVAGKQKDAKGKRKAMDTEICVPKTPPPLIRTGDALLSRRHGKKSSQELKPPHTDTPTRERFNEWGEFRCLYVASQRRATIEYLGGEVRKGSMDYFFDYILPPIRSEFSIDKIFDYCIANTILRKDTITNKYYWEGFSQSPRNSVSHETDVFNKPLVKVFDAITEAARETSGPHLFPTNYLYADGDNATWSERDSKIKPDAQLFVSDPDDTYPKSLAGKHWYNSVLSLHFKKAEKGAYDNAKQVIHSIIHCMSIDPCRRFTFGATIEDTRMRLWIFNRSMVIASDSFDFVTDPITMIKVVLSFVFADKVDLGWDTTLTARYNGSEREFTVDVAGAHFITNSSNVISDIKADGIFTAGTRIYKAFRADDLEEKEPVIIKDYWPGEKYETEDVIYQKILASLSNDLEREFVTGLTLTPILSEGVKVMGKDDHTRIVILRGMNPIATYKLPLPDEEVGKKTCLGKTPEGFTTEPSGQHREKTLKLAGNRIFGFSHRRHYRIVYKEVAIPYHKLRTVGHMAFVLYCAVGALRCIHKARWVHRDLSPGNLYFYNDPMTGESRGLIGDLEFAKQVGTGGDHDVRTGTPDFMAIEVARRSYCFKPVHLMDIKDMEDAEYAQSENKKGVWANYIHDLESIWWVAVWSLFAFQKATDPVSETENYQEMIKKQAYNFSLLFRGTTENLERYNFFERKPAFMDFLHDIPNTLKALKMAIKSIRKSILKYYKAEGLKGADPVLMTDEGSLHDEILEALRPLLNDKTHIIPIKIEPLVITKTTATSKRTTHSARTDDHLTKRARREETSEIEGANPTGSGVLNDAVGSVAQGRDPHEETNVIILESQSGDNQVSQDYKAFVPSSDLAKDKEPSEMELNPRKTRSNSRRKKTNTDASSSKPVQRGRPRSVVINNEPVQLENQRVTRSMSKKATKETANECPEPSSSEKTIVGRVTRSRSKAAASTKKSPERTTEGNVEGRATRSRSKAATATKKSQRRKR